MAKLTLSVEPDKIAIAKRYASKHHTSISKLFSDFIANVANKEENPEDDPLLNKIRQMEFPGWVTRLSDTPKVELPENVDYKELKYEYLKERHGL